ncbi:Alpha/Beta hydrolase protein [Chytriomyces sp. MP71]|nr:Alpha/Beta hydrolase protein [Chytriomyces sp. MP71]
MMLVAFLVHHQMGAGLRHKDELRFLGDSKHDDGRDIYADSDSDGEETRDRKGRGVAMKVRAVKYRPSASSLRIFNTPLPTHPIKVLLINYATLDHIVGMLSGPVIPTAIRWIASRITKPKITTECREPCKQIPRVYQHIPFNTKHTLDVYAHCCQDTTGTELKPVVLFIYGGAWNSGSKALYGPLAFNLLRSGHITVVPDYTLYPQGLVEDALDDVTNALAWTRQHIATYGGDPDQIHIMGHSAGAHLVAMSLVRGAIESARSSDLRVPSFPGEMAPPKQGLNPAVVVRGVVLLAGVFDIQRHFHFEAGRGVEEVSAMRRCMSHTRLCFDARSPGKVLRWIMRQGDGCEVVQRFLPQAWLVVHGDADSTVPVRQSEDLHDILKYECGLDGSRLKVLRNVGHFAIISELTLIDSDYLREFLNDVTEMSKKTRIQ